MALHLCAGGRFCATFRDYTALPAGSRRCVPVRSDDSRDLTCVLEVCTGKVVVHDLVHEHGPEGWSLRVGRYDKLRVAPRRVADLFAAAGLRIELQPGPRGMIRLRADKPLTAGC